jgi:hypothetical protein
MKTVSLVIRAVVDGKRINLYPEQAKEKGLAGTFYLRWTEDGREKWQAIGAVCQWSSRTPPAVSLMFTPAMDSDTGSSRTVTSRDHPPS